MADDHPVVVCGIRSAARKHDNPFEIVAHIDSVDEIEQAVEQHRPDVLVTEVRLKGEDALKKLAELKERRPDLNVVAFSAEHTPTHIARAAALKCRDYVSKRCGCQELFAAVEAAATGQPAPADSLMVETQSKMRRPRQSFDHDVPLTNREMQVLRHISMGLSNREIGKSLGISVETVKEHVQNILRKLDVNDRTQAAVWAVKRGLV